MALSDFKGKYLVLLFYPYDFTYVCPTELISFSDNISKFRDINAEVVAISTDSHFSHLAWTKLSRADGGVGKLELPLLSDKTKKISRAYNVLIEDEADELDGIALRGLFIIDGEGTLRVVQVNDAPVGRNVDETLRLITAFQYADKHGEVCPANWRPGGDTIVPDQQKSKEYFKKAYNTDL